jgi:O-phosphoseryl-tRNA(Cys) synthetase
MGNHISIEMRKTLAIEIISSNIIDESTTLSEKSTLIIYVCICLVNYGIHYHVMFYGLDVAAKCHCRWNF